METIGLDVTLSGTEIGFLEKCGELKKFKLDNGGNNPKLTKSLSHHQQGLARFQTEVRKRKTVSYKKMMQKPKLRAAFEEVDSIPVTVPVTKPLSAHALKVRLWRLTVKQKGIEGTRRQACRLPQGSREKDRNHPNPIKLTSASKLVRQ
jgi:hypothetical protein